MTAQFSCHKSYCLGSHPRECRAREWNGVWHSPSQMLGLNLVPRADWSVTVRPRPGMVEVRTPIFPLPRHHSPWKPTLPSLPLLGLALATPMIRGGSFRYHRTWIALRSSLPQNSFGPYHTCHKEKVGQLSTDSCTANSPSSPVPRTWWSSM